MATLAAIVDVMWGGAIPVGPLFSMGVSLEAAPQYIQTLQPPERAAIWTQVLEQALINFPVELYGQKNAVTIMEYDDGTVKAISTKNYIELLKRTNAKAYEDALRAAIVDGAASSGDVAAVGGGDGADGALSA
jgi:hypothetical protein